MNICVRPPTKTEMEAYSRRQRFAASIAARAAELEQKKLIPVAIQPEAMPAEPDPPPACPVCAENAAREAQEAAKTSERGYPLVADIQRTVGRFYNISRADMCSARRMADLVGPRQIAMYITKEITPLSMPGIGRLFFRDHTTILHAHRKTAARVYADAEFALEVVSLMSEIRGE